MNQGLLGVFKKKTASLANMPFTEPTYDAMVHDKYQYQIIYFLAVNQNVAKSTLYDFLSNKWLPTILTSDGCIKIEIADDFAPQHGYAIVETWMNKRIHDETGIRLSIARKDVLQELLKLATFAFLWEGIIVYSTNSGAVEHIEESRDEE